MSLVLMKVVGALLILAGATIVLRSPSTLLGAGARPRALVVAVIVAAGLFLAYSRPETLL